MFGRFWGLKLGMFLEGFQILNSREFGLEIGRLEIELESFEGAFEIGLGLFWNVLKNDSREFGMFLK